MTDLLDAIARWRAPRVLVVGDLMIDHLVFGAAERLSPEAPVPVLHATRSERRPGGAASLCLALRALKARVDVLGVSGDDPERAALLDLLTSHGVETEGVVADPSRPTTVKQSLIGLAQHRHPQRMFRVDTESNEPVSGAIEGAMLERLSSLLEGADVVCIEDYAKGVCTPRVCRTAIEAARSLGKEIIVDPAAKADYERYRGATVITPNRTEISLVAPDAPPVDAEPDAFIPAATWLVETFDLSAAVVTLDRHGALLVERGCEPRLAPTHAREVYDVAGAGDTVTAALAAARANEIDWHDAVRFANAAAGLEVEEVGVVPIPLERVRAELIRRRGVRPSVWALDELVAERESLAIEGKRVVFTNGCFDILHTGHLSLLRRAAAFGDALIVAINTDDSVRRLGKGPERPINNERDRAELLAGLSCVDAVVLFDDDTPERVIRALKPDVLVKGAEYSIEQVPGARFVLDQGGSVELLEMVEGKSTTAVVEKIAR